MISKIEKNLMDYGVVLLKDKNILRLRSSKHRIIIPNIDENLAYLYGVICGDGCLNTPTKNKRGSYRFRVSISIQSINYVKTISQLIKNLFNLDTTQVFDKTKYALYINSGIVFSYFNLLGVPVGKKYFKMKIPKEIKQDKKLFLQFLAGLIDTDGSVSSIIYLSQKDTNFLNEILKTSKIFGLVVDLKYSPFYIDGEIYHRYYLKFKKDDQILSLLRHPRFFKKN
ncbi:MAG: LAGLIDADG family homing endonuclease [Candidatus Aenigmatarchaeota archaeon]